MKKLFLLTVVVFTLLSCEKKQDWQVTTVSKTEMWNTVTKNMVWSKTYPPTTEIVLDMSEADIKSYCAPKYFEDINGTQWYKYFTTKSYASISK